MNNDLISRSDLKKAIEKGFEENFFSDYEPTECVCKLYDDCIDNAPTVMGYETLSYAKGFQDGEESGLRHRPHGKTNAEIFKQTFGIYATELWSMKEADFLKWLNAEVRGEE